MAATNTVNFNQYTFLKTNYPSGIVDQTFINNILIPGLAKQGRYSGTKKGIELPHGENIKKEDIEYLPLADAATLAIDFLNNNNTLREQEVNTLLNLASAKGFTQLANTLQLITRERVTDPNKLLTARLSENLLAYQKDQTTPDSPPQTNHTKAIDDYHQIHSKITSLISSGHSLTQIQAILPREFTHLDSSLNQAAFISLIATNISELSSLSRLHPDSPELTSRAISKHLISSIDSTRPDLSNTRSFIYANEDEISELVTTIQQKVDNKTLTLFSNTRLRASKSLPYLLPAHHQLRNQITSTLAGKGYDSDSQISITNSLLTTLTNNSQSPLTSSAILSQVASQLGLTNSQLNQLTRDLHANKLDSALEYHQHIIHLDNATRRLTPAEKSLLKRGVNPLHIASTPQQLENQARIFLNISTSSNLPPDYQTSIKNLYSTEQSSGETSHFGNSLRSWLDHHHTITNLQSDSRLSRLSKNARSQRRFFDLSIANKWFEIEDTITGRRAMRKIIDQYDKFAQTKAILKISRKDGSTLNIPLLRLMPWALDGWDDFRRATAIRWLKGLRGTKNPFGKTAQFSLRHYIKGGSTASGAFQSGWSTIWSKKIIIPIANKYLIHLTTSSGAGIFKYAALSATGSTISKNGTRIAIRTLIKIGGGSLARQGAKVSTKAILALTTAATAIGSALGAILAVSFVIDIVKMGVNFVKEFAHNINFRKKVLGIGAFVTGALAALQLAPIGLFLGAIGALMLQTLLLSAGVALGLLAFFMIFFNIFTKLPWDIDSAPGQFLASIICDIDGSDDTSNPTVNTALCIAQVLENSGANPLLENLLSSPIWQVVINALAAFSGAGDQLEHSAQVSNGPTGPGNLQCVGLSAASAAGGGIPFDRQRHACTYAQYEPPGYTYLSGCPNMQPGDHFLTGVENCISETNENGTVGHIGVVIDPSQGAKFTCVDANYLSPGVVRGPEECYFIKSQISGCLRKL